MSLENIAIKLDTGEAFSVGNVSALLSEIAAHLERLIATGEASQIDLKSLPFAPGEYEQLRLLLGQGEVTAQIEAIGPSEITETQYPGVWWVTHYDIDEQVAAEFIEVTYVPEILKTHPADARRAIEALHSRSMQSAEVNEGDIHAE